MLIKAADDKSGDIEQLEALLGRPSIGVDEKKRIEQELRAVRSGLKGEREAAYEIDFYYAPSKNYAVIHDLRLEHNGRVAQIDHPVIGRFLDIWVCESKRFAEGIAVNEHGEFAAFYGGRAVGVPSPLEQNQKHCAVLQALFIDRVIEAPKRLGIGLPVTLHSLVLVSKNARISRPAAAVKGLEQILKVDQFKSFLDEYLNKDNNPLTIAKVIGSDTLEQFARSIAALHKPASFDWAAKFGLQQTEAAPPASTAPTESGAASKLACASCGIIVAYNVARFCWFNKPRFGGRVYCMDCQKAVRAVDG